MKLFELLPVLGILARPRSWSSGQRKSLRSIWVTSAAAQGRWRQWYELLVGEVPPGYSKAGMCCREISTLHLVGARDRLPVVPGGQLNDEVLRRPSPRTSCRSPASGRVTWPGSSWLGLENPPGNHLQSRAGRSSSSVLRAGPRGFATACPAPAGGLLRLVLRPRTDRPLGTAGRSSSRRAGADMERPGGAEFDRVFHDSEGPSRVHGDVNTTPASSRWTLRPTSTTLGDLFGPFRP